MHLSSVRIFSALAVFGLVAAAAVLVLGLMGESRAFWFVTLTVGLLLAALSLGLGYMLLSARREAMELALRTTESMAISAAESDMMFELAQELTFTIDKDGRFAFVSAASRRILGREPADMIGEPYLDFVHPVDRELVARASKSVIETGAISEFECRFLRGDGSAVFLSWNAHSMPEPFPPIFAVGRDVSASRRGRNLRGLILQSAAEAICGLDTDGRIIFMNPAGAAMTGWPADELIGRSLHDTVHYARADSSPLPARGLPAALCDQWWRRDGPGRRRGVLAQGRDRVPHRIRQLHDHGRGRDQRGRRHI